MFDKRELDAFLYLARNLNFRLAAEQLNMSQPTLSRAISRLEHKLGFTLFKRSTRRVQLTDAGATLMEQCRNIDVQLRRAMECAASVAQGTAGLVKVGYSAFPISTCMPYVLKGFYQRFPNIDVDLDMLCSDDQIHALGAGELDAAFVCIKPESPDIEHLLISEHPVALLIRDDHPLAVRPSINAEDLESEPLIVGKHNKWSPINAAIERIIERGGLRSNIILYAMDIASIYSFVGVGLGIGFFIEAGTHLKMQNIVARRITGHDEAIPVYFAWRKHHSNPALEKLINHTSRYISQSNNEPESGATPLYIDA